jgi:hypothetical protein
MRVAYSVPEVHELASRLASSPKMEPTPLILFGTSPPCSFRSLVKKALRHGPWSRTEGLGRRRYPYMGHGINAVRPCELFCSSTTKTHDARDSQEARNRFAAASTRQMHHWDVFDQSTGSGTASTPELESAALDALSTQIRSLERREVSCRKINRPTPRSDSHLPGSVPLIKAIMRTSRYALCTNPLPSLSPPVSRRR